MPENIKRFFTVKLKKRLLWSFWYLIAKNLSYKRTTEVTKTNRPIGISNIEPATKVKRCVAGSETIEHVSEYFDTRSERSFIR